MTEPDMERMARSGAERSCWRIMGILQDSEVLPRFYRWGAMLLQRGWRIAVSMIYGYTKDRKRAWEIMEHWSLQRTGKQGTVHHGRPEDQCGGFNQCRTAF